jgi:hypothetical protein
MGALYLYHPNNCHEGLKKTTKIELEAQNQIQDLLDKNRSGNLTMMLSFLDYSVQQNAQFQNSGSYKPSFKV